MGVIWGDTNEKENCSNSSSINGSRFNGCIARFGPRFETRFSGRWDDSIEKDRDGNFFIDQEYVLFETMINYLRNKSNGTEMFKMESPGYGHFDKERRVLDFHRMVEYYV